MYVPATGSLASGHSIGIPAQISLRWAIVSPHMIALPAEGRFNEACHARGSERCQSLCSFAWRSLRAHFASNAVKMLRLPSTFYSTALQLPALPAASVSRSPELTHYWHLLLLPTGVHHDKLCRHGRHHRIVSSSSVSMMDQSWRYDPQRAMAAGVAFGFVKSFSPAVHRRWSHWTAIDHNNTVVYDTES